MATGWIATILKGTDGDKLNVILADCRFNLRKFLKAIFGLIFKELERLKLLLQPFNHHHEACRDGLKLNDGIGTPET